jgi:hypothetical protein
MGGLHSRATSIHKLEFPEALYGRIEFQCLYSLTPSSQYLLFPILSLEIVLAYLPLSGGPCFKIAIWRAYDIGFSSQKTYSLPAHQSGHF